MKWCNRDLPVRAVVFLVLVGTVVVFLHAHRSRVHEIRRPGLKSNMGTLELALEDFSKRTGGYYPADINTRIKDVLGDMGKHSEDLLSIAGARGVDSVRMIDMGSKGPALLPEKYRNPYFESRPAVVTSSSDPPVWDPDVAGLVFYVPLGVKGHVAIGYKVYGAGPDGRLAALVLSSNEYRYDDSSRDRAQ